MIIAPVLAKTRDGASFRDAKYSNDVIKIFSVFLLASL